MAEMKRYCLCGATANATGSAVPVAGIAVAFDQIHQGPGHGPASPAQARKARRRDEVSHA